MHGAPDVASAVPPSSNHGGKTPPTSVSFSDSGQKAHVDWLGITLPIPEDVHNVPSWAVCELARFGFSNLTDKCKGWFGYKHQQTIDEDCGLIAFGGTAQKGTLHIELTGKGCKVIEDWVALREWCEGKGARITRVDLAHDDHTGKTANLALCRQWLTDGLFSMGARPPKARLIDDLGSGEGSTLYVGARANGKMFRGYEKGKQLGDATSPWFRLEVELRAKDRLIPFDALTNPTPYLAGAFPALAFLSEDQNKIRTVKKAVEASLGRSIDNARNTVGKLVNFLLTAGGWSPQQVARAFQRDGIPSRLKPFDRFVAALKQEGTPLAGSRLIQPLKGET
jgi:phage replication initiation protein